MKTTEELIKEYLSKGGKVTQDCREKASKPKIAPFMQEFKSR